MFDLLISSQHSDNGAACDFATSGSGIRSLFVTRSLRSSETSDGRVEEICRDVPEGQQRVGALVEASSLIRELGADLTEIAASVGLELAALHDRENSIPFSAAVRLVHAAAVRTGCAHFGLLLGRRNAPSQVNFSSTYIFRK